MNGMLCLYKYHIFFTLHLHVSGTPLSILFLSPAVTPWKSTLKGVGPNNPSIRLYSYNKLTGMVLNYQQFYLDLAKSQKSGKDNWNLEYDAVKDYGLRNLDVKNVASLADSFMDDAEDTIFKKYLRYNSVSAAVSPPCNDTCRSVHYCSITQLEKDKYYQCLTGFQTTASPNSTPHHHHHPPPKKVQPYYIYIIAGLGALVFILFIIVAILCIKKRRHFIPHRYSRFGSVIKGPIN